MSIEIETPDGDPVEVFLSHSGIGIDAIVRAESEMDWVQGAVFYGLLVEGEGDLIPAPGVEIDIIGSVVITPATYDDEGAVTSPPVMDPRYHLNLRIHGPALEKLDEKTGLRKWEAMAVNWTRLGDMDTTLNADERAQVLHNVGLIDPASIASPRRVWL